MSGGYINFGNTVLLLPTVKFCYDLKSVFKFNTSFELMFIVLVRND